MSGWWWESHHRFLEDKISVRRTYLWLWINRKEREKERKKERKKERSIGTLEGWHTTQTKTPIRWHLGDDKQCDVAAVDRQSLGLKPPSEGRDIYAVQRIFRVVAERTTHEKQYGRNNKC
jgi:hypothetical protein